MRLDEAIRLVDVLNTMLHGTPYEAVFTTIDGNTKVEVIKKDLRDGSGY